MGCGISKTHENEELEELQLSETQSSQQSGSQSINSQIELKPMITWQNMLYPDQKECLSSLQIIDIHFFESINNGVDYNPENTIESLLNELEPFEKYKKRHRVVIRKKSRRIKMRELEQLF